MTRVLFAIAVLALVTLACEGPNFVITLTPTASPTQPEPSPVPSATATRTQEAGEDVQTSIVRVPIVRVRVEPGGASTEQYVYAGQEVTVLETDGDWVRIEEPEGWIFSGCLEGSQRGCLAE